MCKHVAAVLYGVGSRLDNDPALLFLLRGVDHNELIDAHAEFDIPKESGKGPKRIENHDLEDIFGIELGADPQPVSRRRRSNAKKAGTQSKKAAPKRTKATKKRASAQEEKPTKATPKKSAGTNNTARKVKKKRKHAIASTKGKTTSEK